MEYSSPYIRSQRREYSLYVLQSRAIPHAADGLKAAARRVLWIGRDGKKYKSATLAGATLPIHPHTAPEDAVNTIAGPYRNNIPLLHGIGAMGTMLSPTSYGASRYTSVSLSQFTKDILFKDLEILPMRDNYDGTLQEPVHFLPLVPIVLLNPSEGIAVGFASSILPRTLDSIIKSQLQALAGKEIQPVFPTFTPTNNVSTDSQIDSNGKTKWLFEGEYTKVNATTIRITKVPYGISYEKYLAKLYKMEDAGTIIDIEDNSRNKYDILIKFKKGTLTSKSDAEIKKLVHLNVWVSENLNIINFDGEAVWSTTYNDIITEFTKWRLGWYVQRYERLSDLLKIKIQRYVDFITTIDKNVHKMLTTITSRSELKALLDELGVVHTDYIADLPIYRFTEEEANKTREKLKEAEALLAEYSSILGSEERRKDIYASELKQALTDYNKGKYNTTT